ncbi:MAG: acyltransferase, partial [Thermoleophilaceae bacterium]
MIPIRERLDPRGFRRRNVDSAWWHWLVNVAAASPALDRRTRARLLRAAGIEIDKAIVEAGCFFFGANVSLGDYALISHGCYLDSKDRISVGARTGVAMGVALITSNHELGGELQRMGRFHTAPIEIGEGAWIGARSLVLPGVTVGDGSIVAGGAVVTRDVEPHSLYAGVPAK